MLNIKLEGQFGGKTMQTPTHIACIRRQLQDDKQGLEETDEIFANKVLEMTTDRYPDTKEDCRQTEAIDAFLTDC